MSEMVTGSGSWTGFDFTITPEIRKFFDDTVKLIGVKYTPLAVATQVVAGMNYCFICQGTPVYPSAQDFAAKLYIYKPLQGDPHITQIVNITP